MVPTSPYVTVNDENSRKTFKPQHNLPYFISPMSAWGSYYLPPCLRFLKEERYQEEYCARTKCHCFQIFLQHFFVFPGNYKPSSYHCASCVPKGEQASAGRFMTRWKNVSGCQKQPMIVVSGFKLGSLRVSTSTQTDMRPDGEPAEASFHPSQAQKTAGSVDISWGWAIFPG